MLKDLTFTVIIYEFAGIVVAVYQAAINLKLPICDNVVDYSTPISEVKIISFFDENIPETFKLGSKL
jgi:hypothetical protein